MLIVGHLIRLAEEWCKDAVVSGVRSRFVAPVGVSEFLSVEGRAISPPDAKRGNPCLLRIVAKNNRGMIAVILDVEFDDERQRWPSPSTMQSERDEGGTDGGGH
jgi:hypothetical protein